MAAGIRESPTDTASTGIENSTETGEKGHTEECCLHTVVKEPMFLKLQYMGEYIATYTIHYNASSQSPHNNIAS